MRRFAQSLFIAGSLMLLVGATDVLAQEFTIDKENAVSKKAEYSPFVDQHFPTRVGEEEHTRGTVHIRLCLEYPALGCKPGLVLNTPIPVLPFCRAVDTTKVQ